MRHTAMAAVIIALMICLSLAVSASDTVSGSEFAALLIDSLGLSPDVPAEDAEADSDEPTGDAEAGSDESPLEPEASVSPEVPTESPSPAEGFVLTFEPVVTHPANDDVSALSAAGALDVYDIISGGFVYDDALTRETAVKMTVRALRIHRLPYDTGFYVDSDSTWAEAAANEYLYLGDYTEDGDCEFRGGAAVTLDEAIRLCGDAAAYHDDPGNTRAELTLEYAAAHPILSERGFIDLFCSLNRLFIGEFTFSSPVSYQVWSEYYPVAQSMHPEIFMSEGYKCVVNREEGTFTLTIQYGSGTEELRVMRDAAAARAEEIVAALIAEGNIGARALTESIHTYLLAHCAYDYDNYIAGTIPAEAYTAYGALINGTAVCQGYSAAYNMLCNAADIPCVAVPGYYKTPEENHRWNLLYIDGELLYSDATFDDPVPDTGDEVSATHFLLTQPQMKQLGYMWFSYLHSVRYLF